jgi:hypothetical protein
MDRVTRRLSRAQCQHPQRHELVICAPDERSNVDHITAPNSALAARSSDAMADYAAYIHHACFANS